MKKKILIIDDDVDLVDMTKAFLIQHDYEVFTAYNGVEGIECLKNCKPDFVILDVMMTSVGEGFEVAQEIRKLDSVRDIPILMVSSVNEQHDFPLMFGPDDQWNPVNDFLNKPVQPQLLLDKISELLKIKSSD